jgi:hypothetical protein
MCKLQRNIAIAPQNFQNQVFFFTSWGSFPDKKERKKVFMKNLPGASNIMPNHDCNYEG